MYVSVSSSFWSVYFVLFCFIFLLTCLFFTERGKSHGVEVGRVIDGEDLGGDEGGETDQNILYEKYFQLNKI